MREEKLAAQEREKAAKKKAAAAKAMSKAKSKNLPVHVECLADVVKAEAVAKARRKSEIIGIAEAAAKAAAAKIAQSNEDKVEVSQSTGEAIVEDYDDAPSAKSLFSGGGIAEVAA